jgi:uncharacterized protein YecE (DUF72 family)
LLNTVRLRHAKCCRALEQCSRQGSVQAAVVEQRAGDQPWRAWGGKADFASVAQHGRLRAARLSIV